MESHSSEEPRLIKPFNFLSLQGKRPMLLSPERELQPVENEGSRERKLLSLRPRSPLRLELSLPMDKRMVDKSPADDMERVREENQKLKEEISFLHADNTVLRSRLHQTPDLLDNRPSAGEGLNSSSSNASTNNEDLGSSYLQKGDAPLMNWNLHQEKAPKMAMKGVKVSVRTRANIQMVSDGCQWRKYGQKKAKGSPCPRSYYRCTMASGCPVRKQVQKWANDPSILTSTYEGQHNHPLPPVAKLMSSMIMSAAEMFLSGSMYNKAAIPRDLAPFLSPGMVYVSNTDRFPTVTLDMTNSAPFANPLQRNYQIFGANQTAMVPQVNDRIAEAITSNPRFHATIAAAVTSFIGGTPKH